MVSKNESRTVSYLISQSLINQVKRFATKENVSQDFIVSMAIKSFMDRYEYDQYLIDCINNANQTDPTYEETKVFEHMQNLHAELIQEEQW